MNTEFNIIVNNENVLDGDIKLFWGEENPPNLIWIDPSWDMWDLLAHLKLFPSKSQVRKDPKWGAITAIPLGWTEFQFGKKRIAVSIFNPF
jgi:hypothetical protein